MSSQKQSPTPVIVWCHPRSVSSAFERAFMQRKDTRSYHEPLSMPFYYGDRRACRRYSDQECKDVAEGRHWQSTIEGVLKDILRETENGTEENVVVGQREQGDCNYIFIKDMAQYVFSESALKRLHPSSTVYKSNAQANNEPIPGPLDNPTVLPIDLLRRFKHTFLMRTPKKSVPSYWKCVQEGAAGFTYFDAAEAGYVELRILYDWMADKQSTFHTAPESNDVYTLPGQVQAQPMPPPLVDASDLLAMPDTTVKQYCEALGVPFEPSMLTWESGKVNAFSSWQGYHTAAENSTGFKSETPATNEAEEAARRRRQMDSNAADKATASHLSNDTDSSSSGGESEDAEEQQKKAAKKNLPGEVTDAISANMDSYNYLYSLRSFKQK